MKKPMLKAKESRVLRALWKSSFGATESDLVSPQILEPIWAEQALESGPRLWYDLKL